MLRLLILLIIALLTIVDAHAGWVEQRWTDSQGRNHQGTVSPPSNNTYNNNNYTPNNNTTVAPPQPTIQQIEKKISKITASGAEQFNAGNYDAALEIWMKAYDLCQQYGMSTKGCYELDQRMLTAMAYRDSKARQEREKLEAEQAAKRRETEQVKQRAKARQRVQSLLENTAVDFDGTGRGIDLTPMLKPAPGISKQPSSLDAGHPDANTVDLRFMDPDKLDSPKLQKMTPAKKERGVRYKSVPLPEAVMPKDPKVRFAMKDSATHIMDAIEDSGGDLAQALRHMENSLMRLGADNQAGQEAYSYLLGLYASEILYGDKKTDPFKPSQSDSKALMDVVSYLEPQENMALIRDEEAVKNSAAINAAFKSQNAWLERILAKYGGDLEKSLHNLRNEKEPGARYAYQFIQGLIAYHDMGTIQQKRNK
jgi:hypothetical protein